ncbi:uracil-DNA glycosylase [Corynebacterium crudilactis]|uniref:Uracil-DNA glycosylase n=1 Tax=Corynebacterium crudilactis TaxID=1652495 RepID=A0A172QT57_9CORY|nr:uracil-DNA glycosylase [Corynebacterium crudilactis]ANE03889.1 uracil-DNA glycosylase [Corynebacterium crudilactis]
MTTETLWSSIDELPIHDSWKPVLKPVEDTIIGIGAYLVQEVQEGRGFLPAQEDIFKAFSYPFESVKVLIMGQDPYPTPGHAMGLSFSTQPGVRPLPRSLNNIFKELSSDIGSAVSEAASADTSSNADNAARENQQGTLDLGLTAIPVTSEATPAQQLPVDGDLRAWSNQGVALFNRVLTVSPGQAGSHKGKGWEIVTEQAITALAQRPQPLVAILWGKQAQEVQKFLGDTPTICSVHPSPLSASRGFFGSKPFSQANEILDNLGTTKINWQL